MPSAATVMWSGAFSFHAMEKRKLEALLIDLDNTLYSPQTGLLAEADRRITEFIARRLGMAWEQADRLRVDLWRRYGTTASGLAAEYGIPESELAAEALGNVKAEEYVGRDEKLVQALEELELPLYVFTNAPRAYAQRALDALGIRHLFVDVFDIEFLGWEGKPSERAFRKVLRILALPPHVVGLADDNPDNLAQARRLGMVTIAVHVQCEADVVIDDIRQIAKALREARFI